jgi:hypothetical protein
LLELSIHQPIFIGFKADSSLRQRLETLSDSEKQYASVDDSAFLQICRIGEDTYVGKIIRDTLTTDRVDDIRRNIVSIIQRLDGNVRTPTSLKIFACTEVEADALLTTNQLGSPRTDRDLPVTRPAAR